MPLSSNGFPRLRLTAAQIGLDPILHYWCKIAKYDYRRLCDDTPWDRGLRYNPPPVKECYDCRAMYRVDRQMGPGVFSLTYIVKGVFALRSHDALYVPSMVGYNANVNNSMKPVTVTTFSRFCVASEKEREKIVDNFKNPKYGPRNQALRGMFQRTHWKSGCLGTLIEATPNVSSSSTRLASIVGDAEELKRHYIAVWRSRGASFFNVPTVDVPIDGLVLRVDPEVGMQTVDGYQALKVWLNKKPMTISQRVVFHYLVGEADRSPMWPGWPIGIWDVRRQTIPLAPRLPDGIEDDVLSAASDFIRRYQGE